MTIAAVVVVCLFIFIFATEDNDSVYYKQYMLMSDNYNTRLDPALKGKVQDYIDQLKNDINTAGKETGAVGKGTTVENSTNSSGTPNTITGNFQQYSDGFSADGFTIHVDPNSDRGKVIAAALSMLGYPYQYGGEGKPWKGELNGHTWRDPKYSYESRKDLPAYDCSAFCQAAYKKGIGMDIPRTSGPQSRGGTTVGYNGDTSRMKPGDLAGDGDHVVMYLGDGLLIEAPSTGKTVRIISIQDRYGSSNFPSKFTCASYLN